MLFGVGGARDLIIYLFVFIGHDGDQRITCGGSVLPWPQMPLPNKDLLPVLRYVHMTS